MKPYELVRLLFRARAKHDLRLVLRIFCHHDAAVYIGQNGQL